MCDDSQETPTNGRDGCSDEEDDDEFDNEGGFKIGNAYIPPAPPRYVRDDADKPRLVISKIVVENFKSYAGKVVIGPFHKNFSCVIGPNGSGKSNVIDSLLFVFGCRASKIRSKKISVLIHKSAKCPNFTFCCVQVHFAKIVDKGGNEYETVADFKLVVSRTAYTDSSSHYTLNDRKVPFKQIARVLREHNIDLLYNRFLILQGEVEKISLMRPKAEKENEIGMLEYIEDIIGTTRYIKPLEELQRQVSELDDLRGNRYQQMLVVNKERIALQQPMETARNFLKCENRIAILENTKLQKLRRDMELSMANEIAEKDALEKEVEEKKKEIDALKNDQKEHSERIDELNELINESNSRYEEIKKYRNDYEKKCIAINEDIATLQKTIQKLEDTVERERALCVKYRDIPETNEKEIEELRKREKSLVEEIEKREICLQEAYRSLQSDTASLQEEKEKLRNEMKSAQKIYDDASSKLELAQSEKELLLRTRTEEANKEQTIRRQLEEATSAGDKCAQTMETTKASLTENKNTLREFESEKNELDGKESSIASKLGKLRNNVQALKSSATTNVVRGKVANFFAKLQAEGKLPGFYGRLGDLGWTDPKYDVAISTACGPLDYFVVDTTDTVVRCINLLKEYSVGRASFVSLDKIGYLRSQHEAHFVAPQHVHRLIDLIKVNDEKFRLAFYFGVRNTLLANNIDQATKIAYGSTRHRVVTLNGEIIEVSGALTGGGKQMQRGRIRCNMKDVLNSSARKDDEGACNASTNLKDTLDQISELESQLSEVIGARDNLADQVAKLRKTIVSDEALLQRTTMQARNLSLQMRDLDAQLKLQVAAVTKVRIDNVKLEELRRKVDNYEKEVTIARDKVSPFEKEIALADEEIKRLTKSKTGNIQSEIDQLNAQLREARVNVTKLQSDISSATRNLKKSTKNLENAQKKLRENIAKKERVDEERKAISENPHVVSDDTLNEMESKVKELRKEHESANKIFRSYGKKVSDLEVLALKTEQRLEAIDSSISNQTREMRHAEKKMAELKLHSVPRFANADKIVKEFAHGDDDLEEDGEAKRAKLEEEGRDRSEGAERTDADADTSKGVSLSTDANADTSKNVSSAMDEEEEETFEFKTYSPAELDQLDLKEIERKTKEAREYLSTLNAHLDSLTQYERKMRHFLKQVDELKDVSGKRRQSKIWFKKVQKLRIQEFNAGFSIIKRKLKQTYRTITMEGDADLDLVDSMDPFLEGISFSIRPPYKSWKEIFNLSGGEKTLASLALVFALHYYKPTPFYVMDEIDAALDYRNVSIIAHFIKERTTDAQFIVISLRQNMFQLGCLVTGVYKFQDCANSVTIDVKGIMRHIDQTKSEELSREAFEELTNDFGKCGWSERTSRNATTRNSKNIAVIPKLRGKVPRNYLAALEARIFASRNSSTPFLRLNTSKAKKNSKNKENLPETNSSSFRNNKRKFNAMEENNDLMASR